MAGFLSLSITHRAADAMCVCVVGIAVVDCCHFLTPWSLRHSDRVAMTSFCFYPSKLTPSDLSYAYSDA